jgi:hypothetical protein
MAKNQEISVTAELKDADGETVKDPAIEWYIDPESTGSGTVLTRPHFPDRAKFLNVVLVNTDPNNPAAVIPVYGGGSVRIVARARLGGMDFVKATDPITLVGDP